MPCSRQMPATFSPTSCCLRMAAICDSLNFLVFLKRLLERDSRKEPLVSWSIVYGGMFFLLPTPARYAHRGGQQTLAAA